MDDKPYVMLLASAGKSQGQRYYDAVNSGCAVKVLAVEKGKVEVNGKEILLENILKKTKEPLGRI